MKFSRAFLQEIKDRLNLSDIVGQRVTLKRSGRAFKGLCPFHDEKTPSFQVDDTRQSYYCFGCGAKGDVIDFVMAYDHLPFPDTVKMLAGQAGISLPHLTPEQRQAERERETLYRLMQDTAQWFHEQLAEPEHRHALNYLVKRGISAQLIETYQLGYAPADGRLLRDYLRQQGYSDREMLCGGVMQKSSRSRALYSPFRERIIFPIQDIRGRAVAFGGRVLPENLRAPPASNTSGKPPKYLNSKETPLFHKGHLLYGEPQARAMLGDGRPLAVVEGYTDVLACHQAGLPAVAPLGTALSKDQSLRLWQMTPDTEKVPVLCFDGDAAGQRAAQNALERLLPLLKPDHSARLAFLPAGEDPDTLITRQGKAAFETLLARALPLDRYLWLLHTYGQRFDTPETRAGLETRLHRAAEAIQDETVRHYYHQALTDKLRHFMAAAARLQQDFAEAGSDTAQSAMATRIHQVQTYGP
jgi:DNA primase